DAGYCEYGSEQINVDSQSGVRGRGIEVDVCIQLFLGIDVLLDLARHLEPLRIAAGAAEIFGHAAQVRSAWILCCIYTMPESGNLLLLSQETLHVLHWILPCFVDHKQHPHNGLVGSAMQRSLQRADGAGDRRMHV